jgi:hypothetical protein
VAGRLERGESMNGNVVEAARVAAEASARASVAEGVTDVGAVVERAVEAGLAAASWESRGDTFAAVMTAGSASAWGAR